MEYQLGTKLDEILYEIKLLNERIEELEINTQQTEEKEYKVEEKE